MGLICKTEMNSIQIEFDWFINNWVAKVNQTQFSLCKKPEENSRRRVSTLKEREWGAKVNASPLASEKPLMKGTVESRATMLWAWASTTSISSIASLSSVKSISLSLGVVRCGHGYFIGVSEHRILIICVAFFIFIINKC